MTSELKKPEYITRDRNGAMVRMHCKCCGCTIFEQNKHLPIYAEIKMKFLDGSNAHHVTNSCRKCSTIIANDPDLLLACFHADLDDMIKEDPRLEVVRGQTKPRVVVINYGGRGTP